MPLRHCTSQRYFDTHTQSLLDIHIGSTVALQKQQMRDIYGTVVAIGDEGGEGDDCGEACWVH